MAAGNLTSFISRLDKELSKYEDYRKELNRAPHTFVFHKRTLLTETLTQLSMGQGMTLNTDDKEHIKKLVDIAATELHSQLEQIAGTKLKRPGGKTTVIFDAHTDVPVPTHLNQVLPYPAFTRVKFAYRKVMNKYFTDMQDYFRNHKDLDTIKTKSGKEKSSIIHFFDAGHDKNAGVFERFLDTKTASIMAAINSKGESASEEERNKIVAEMNKALGIDLQITKIDDLDSIIIKIESSSSNRSRGQKQGLRSRELRRKVKAYLKTTNLENLEGSDSLKTRKIKKTKRVVLDPFKKVSGVTVSAKNTKDKKSNKSPVSKSIKPSIAKKATLLAGTTATVAKTRKNRTKGQSSRQSFNPLEIVTAINKELPATVRRNMGAPALENQTGRFAESARVTDIMQTRKGFPSIGYTYQRNPYEVFETGSGTRFADPDRDPRKIIDQSIREIAAQFMMGRFYTRRQ